MNEQEKQELAGDLVRIYSGLQRLELKLDRLLATFSKQEESEQAYRRFQQKYMDDRMNAWNSTFGAPIPGHMNAWKPTFDEAD
jgi:hypothetical protein